MASKTISLHVDAYERLRRAKRHPSESFSQVVMRAKWPEEPMTAREYLKHRRKTGSLWREDELADVERLKRVAEPPADKWPS